MNQIKLFSGMKLPLEMHRVKVVQKLSLPSIKQRKENLEEAGNNQFLLKNSQIFLDMLTDSGVNAMSDKQLAAMMTADDAYAGSETFYELQDKVKQLFGFDFFLPAHQGRACEHLLAKALVKTGDVIPMNYHFTTTKAHIVACGGRVEEVLTDEGLHCNSEQKFKGNVDLNKLEHLIDTVGAENIPFMRVEAGTNLIGGQPISLENIEAVSKLCKAHGIMMVLDASLLQDNLYFIKVREEACKTLTIKEIAQKITSNFDIMYFSARKLGFARGGGICLRDRQHFDTLKEMVTLYEGFLTYGGISITELAALTVGLEETMDFDMIAQGPQFIEYMVDQLDQKGIPVVKPAGGLGCHIDARAFLPHIPSEHYPAAALNAALYLAGGIRTMERGTVSEDRNLDGSEHIAAIELVRLALPRRVFTKSQIDFVVDRIHWLYENRQLIGGLKFTEEPKTLRFFIGRLAPLSDWQDRLIEKYQKDFPESL